MGYRRSKVYKLVFEDFPGLEVCMKGLSVKAFMSLARCAGSLGDLDDLASLKGDELEAALAGAGELFDRFADRLQSWTLEDDDTGDPVPATREGVGSQDFDFILRLVTDWMDAVASVDTPLKQPSANTPPSGLGLSEAMEPLSPNPGS